MSRRFIKNRQTSYLRNVLISIALFLAVFGFFSYGIVSRPERHGEKRNGNAAVCRIPAISPAAMRRKALIRRVWHI